jgi:diadenylate cyclase
MDLTQLPWPFELQHSLLYVFDVLIVSWLVYRLLLVIRGTRAEPMLWGLSVVVAAYFLARSIGLNTLAWLLGNFLGSIILVVVVLFQDEIRRALTKVGLYKLFVGNNSIAVDKTLDDLVHVAQQLSKERTGALIVLQGKVGLDELVEEAVPLDALVGRKLLYTLFQKESTLHDGAVVVKGNRIRVASCVLPLSVKQELDPGLGTRHRAALGLTERSDAGVIVVSEQTGAISFVVEGKLASSLDPASLREELGKFYGSAKEGSK